MGRRPIAQQSAPIIDKALTKQAEAASRSIGQRLRGVALPLRPILNAQSANSFEVDAVACDENAFDRQRDGRDGQVVGTDVEFLRAQLIENERGGFVKRQAILVPIELQPELQAGVSLCAR